MKTLNWVLIVLIVLSAIRVASDGTGAGESIALFMGATLWLLVPLLTLNAITPQAGTGARRAAYAANGIGLAGMALVVLFAATGSELVAVSVGALVVALPFALNIRGIWTRRKGEAAKTDLREEPATLSAHVVPNEAILSAPPGSAARRTMAPPPTSVAPGPRAGNYFARHWRGDLSLPLSYWVNGSLFMLVVLLLTSATDAALETASLVVMSTVKLFLLLLLVTWTFWSSIGIWRSAQKHPARGGSRGWALIAQIMVCLCLLSFAGSLPTTILPQLKEYTLIVAGRDPLGRVDAKVSTNGRALILHGALGAGSAAEVRRLLEAAPGVRIVMLDSPGGRIKEAEDLAALVSANGLDTYVEGHCESACTYVFLAGRDRAATPTANIGFHSPTFPGLDESAKRALLSRMQAVYREAGISQGFLDKIAATPAESMWYPNRKELIDNGVINRMSLGGEVASLTTRIALSKADMARAFREIPLAAAIERRFPGTIDQMADALSRGRETGATDAELLSAVRQMIASHVPRLLAAANDEQLQEFFELTHAQLRAARTVSYEACRMVLASQLDITKALPPEHVEREMRWLMNVLDRPLAPAPPVNATRLDSVLESVFETISPEHVDILAHPAAPNTDPSLQCDATIALYDALGDLPARDRSIALRGFFGAGE